MSVPTDYEGLFAFVAAWLATSNPGVTLPVWLSTLVPTNPRPKLPYATVLFTTLDVVKTARDELVGGLATAVQITGGTTGTTYTLAVQTVPVTYTRVAGDTNASVAAALYAAVVTSALWPLVTATAASDVLFIAARGGVTLSVTTSDPNLSLTTGLPYYLTRGSRSARASIQTYGGYGSQALASAVRCLGLPNVIAALAPYYVWPTPRGGIRNLSAFMDTNNEARAVLEVDLQYMVESRLDSALPALFAVFNTTFNPGGIATTFTAELS